MSERILEEPIELTDAELEVVSGGRMSAQGDLMEDLHESARAQFIEDLHFAAGIGPAKNGNLN